MLIDSPTVVVVCLCVCVCAFKCVSPSFLDCMLLCSMLPLRIAERELFSPSRPAVACICSSPSHPLVCVYFPPCPVRSLPFNLISSSLILYLIFLVMFVFMSQLHLHSPSHTHTKSYVYISFFLSFSLTLLNTNPNSLIIIFSFPSLPPSLPCPPA